MFQRREEEFSPKPIIRTNNSTPSSLNISLDGIKIDEKTMEEFKELYSTEMIEYNSRTFMEKYWIQKQGLEKTVNLVTFIRDVIFKVPQHEEKELQLETSSRPTQSNRQRFEELLGGLRGNSPSINNLMQLLTGLREPAEPVSNVRVPTDESVNIGSDWLDCVLCYGQMHKESYYKKILTTNRGVCGKTWVAGQIAFKCKTCQMDPTCAICEECFKKGNHEGHDYSMTRNSNGMCDCGDVEAWNVAGFCCDHTGRSDPLAHLTSDYLELLTAIIKGLFSKEGVIINYIREITTKFKSLTDEQARKKSFQLQTLYQNFKHVLDTVLENINSSPCLKRLAYMELKELKNGSTSLDEIILSMPSMTQSIKYIYSDLFLALITDIDFKLFFSERFIAHYSLIIEDFKVHLTKKNEIKESDEEEKTVHISSLSVQLLTTPTVAAHLIENCNLVSILLDTLIELVEDEAIMDILRNNRLVYRPQSNSRKGEALYHIIFDINYCVMHQKFSDQILLNEDCYHKFLTFLSYLQATTDIRRLDSDESKWYPAFNLEMGTLPKIIRTVTSFIEGYTEESRYKNLLTQLLGTLTKFIQDDNLEIETDGTVKVNPFNIPITYNLPLHRFGTTIFKQLMSRFPAISLKAVISEILEQTTPNSPQVTNQFLIQLLDHPLKSFVTTAQINGRLWQRNHEHILEQSFNYNSEPFGDYTYCNDMFLIQIITGLIDDHDIIYRTLIKKFNNSQQELKLFTTEKLKEDEDKRSILEEEFVRLLISISTNRILMDSMSNFDICRKYILHYLFSEDKCKFSDIVASVPKSFRSAGIDIKVIVTEVANFHKPKGSNDQGYFTVKSNYWDEFDPYFIGMNSQSFYQAIEHYKTQTSSKQSPPIWLEKPIFAPNQQLESGLTGMMKSNILYKIIFLNMYRTIKWRKESSQEQLPAFILHLLLLSLNHVNTGQDVFQTTTPSKKTLFSPIKSHLDIPFKDGESPIKYILQPVEADDGNEYSIINMLFEFESQGDMVTRVFNRLIELNETCDKIIVEAKSRKENTNNKEEKEAKKKRALANRQKLLEKMNTSQKIFAQSLEEVEEADEDIDKRKCAFCHDHKSPEGSESLSLLCQIVNNPFPQITNNKENNGLYGNIRNKPIVDIGELTEVFADINKEQNVQINFCSHACHADCFDRYYTNLIQEESRRRRFKGFGQISLDSMEILCPICSRVANCLCPIVSDNAELESKTPISNTGLPSLETISSFMKNIKIKEKAEDVKISTTLSTICEKIINKKKEDLGDTLDPMPNEIEPYERTDSAYFSNTFSSEIAVEEILQRSQPHLQALSDSSRHSLNHVFGLLISFQQLNEKNRDKTLQEINAIVGSMMGLKSNGKLYLYDEARREKKMYLPFLSGDMFSLFVRFTTLLISSEKKMDSNMFRDLLTVFYTSHVIQIIVQCNLRLQQTFSTGVPSIDKAISTIENIPIFERFELRNLDSDLLLSESDMCNMSNSFLRRVALYYSLLFPEEEIPTEESEHVNLTKYLHLPPSDQLLTLVRESPSYIELISQWVDQVKSSMQSLSKALRDEIQDEDDEDLYVSQADSLIPCFSAPKPFSFIELPRLYEDLLLKYHNTKCPTCSKKLENPAICLITGELVWLKQCSCETRHVCGKITRYAREKYSGFGLFLVIKSSRILLMHEGRSGILHSPYLDSHGEEDKNLKRGVPLFFHKERLDENIQKLGRMTWDHDTIILEKCSNLQTHVL